MSNLTYIVPSSMELSLFLYFSLFFYIFQSKTNSLPSSFITLNLWESCKRLCFAMRRGASSTSSNSGGNGGNGEKKEGNKEGKKEEKEEKEEEENERAEIVFSSAVSCLLFDLRIWARGSYEVHGNVCY